AITGPAYTRLTAETPSSSTKTAWGKNGAVFNIGRGTPMARVAPSTLTIGTLPACKAGSEGTTPVACHALPGITIHRPCTAVASRKAFQFATGVRRAGGNLSGFTRAGCLSRASIFQ